MPATLDPAPRAQPYDFRRPRLLSKDQMRTLTHVHETFARDLAVLLSTQLRTIVDVRVASVEQMPYSEYVMTSASPSALYVVEAEAGTGTPRFVFEWDPRLVIFVVEKLFGGSGMALGAAREVSQIEQGIVRKVVHRALAELAGAWAPLHTMDLAPVAFESNAEFIQITSAAASTFAVRFEVNVYEQQTSTTLCYPYLMLERLLSRSGMKQMASKATSEVPPAVRGRYQETLRDVTVELHAELGQTRLPLSALQALEVGDVIPLQGRVDEPVRVFVNTQETFRAAAGKAGKRRALRILDVLNLPDAHADDAS